MRIIADRHIPFVQEYFNAYGELILKPGRSISAKDVKNADILLVRSVTNVNAQLLADSQVKFIGSVTAGKDHIDTKWLDKAGIAWSIAAGFNAPPVADYVVSAIAALQQKKMLSKEVKAAVIGVGKVGQLVTERLRILGFDITLNDPIRAQQEKDFVSIPIQELSDLDLILLHVPLTTMGDYATYHFIDKHFLKRQKPGSIILNASRGAVIQSQDLMEYGQHLHWVLDVFENEPKINKEILERAMITTPHIAGYSVQSKIRGIEMIYRIACEKNIIEPQPIAPLTFPQQKLCFAGINHNWQEIVLGVFNPLVVTAMMKSQLLPAKDYGTLFDEMRNQFNYRNEFAFTTVDASTSDRTLLQQFGLKLI